MALTSGSYNDIFNAVPFRFSLSSCERRGYSKSKMRFIHFLCVFFLSFSLVLPPSAQAYWIWSPAEGKFVKPESTSTEPQKSADEIFEYAQKLRQSGKDDEEAIQELKRLVRQYPNSAYA